MTRYLPRDWPERVEGRCLAATERTVELVERALRGERFLTCLTLLVTDNGDVTSEAPDVITARLVELVRLCREAHGRPVRTNVLSSPAWKASSAGPLNSAFADQLVCAADRS